MIKRRIALLSEADLLHADRCNGATITLLVNLSRSLQSIINSIKKIRPQGAFPPYYHHCEERVEVLSGTGIALVDEIDSTIKTVYVTRTPVNLPYQFRNELDKDNMVVFWSYASTGATRTMVENCETHFIDAEYKT